MQSTADIPTWSGILMFMVGLAITVAMGKWVARREKTRNGLNSKS